MQNAIPSRHPLSPPVIGISGASTDSKSVAAMVAQVRAMGGIPMVLSNHGSRNPEADIEKIDALFGMGNDYDIDPTLYIDGYAANDPRHQIHPKTNSTANSPEATARLAYEKRMVELAAERNLPTLGVCGFMHLINVMRGGGLLQHIPDQIGDEHHEQNKAGIGPFSPVIPVTVEQNSVLGMIASATPTFYTPSYPPPMGTVGTMENSFHHQAIDPDRVGYGLRVSAYSDPYRNVNGEQRYLPEAIEPDPNGPLANWPMRAVQFHPEFGASEVSSAIIRAAINDAAVYAQHTTRDRSNDQTAARMANLVSVGKPDNFVRSMAAQKQVGLAMSV